jgi:aminopeptidase N
MQCAIVSEPKQVVRVPGCDPVFVNRAATGYYLTEYTPQTLAEIKAHVGDLTAAERVALLRDEGRLLRVGFRGVGDYLALAESFRSERDPDVLEQIVETLQFIDETVTADATREPFRQWVRSFLGPIVNEVGWAPGSGEAEARTELRAKAMEALGNIGRDKKTIEQAKTLARRALDNPSSVEPTLASAALAVAAAYGDAKFYDRVLRGIDSAKTPEQRARLMATLTEFRDPALARRTLEWAVSPAVRIQDFGRLAGGTLANYEVRRAAWDYLTTNWAKVAARIPGLAFGGLGAVVGSAGGFCDAEMRESVRTFFGAHPIPGTERRLAQALERIEQCADIRTLQSPKLEEWLGKK